MILPKLKKY